MAKPKDLRALAAQTTGALLDRSRSDAGARATPAADAARVAVAPGTSAADAARHHYAPSHATDRRARHDVYDSAPTRIVERGPYIREWDEDGPAFQRLLASVQARGQIDTPIWVRSSGGAGNRQLVLIAGKGRLRAALEARLAYVPVRDFGVLDDREAVLLQAAENFDRSEMTPAQTAHTFHLMLDHGLTQKEIVAVRRKNPGYVSVMVRIGDALQELTPLERFALDRPGALQVRQCQVLAASGTREAIVAGLRELAATAIARPAEEDDHAADPAQGPPDTKTARHVPPGSRPDSAPSAFVGRPIRNGRTFRMRWEARDVQRDPVALATGFLEAFRVEGEQLRDALGRAADGDAVNAATRDAIARMREALDAVIEALPRG